MSDEELYNILLEYKTSVHHSKVGRILKRENIFPSTRCIQQTFKLIIQKSKQTDGVAVAQLLTLLAVSLPHDGYKLVDDQILRSLKTLHLHLSAIKRSHHIYKIYHVYLQIITEILNAKLNRKTNIPMQFSPVLFDIAINYSGMFAYDLQMEAGKTLNTLFEEPNSGALHKSLTENSTVKSQWLKIGEAVKSSGDLELQLTLMELLFRLMVPSKRMEHVKDLFPIDEEVQQTFLQLQDEEFEKGCRIFLNMLNGGMEQCMVYSFKCQRVNVGTTDLRIAPNQKWLDINFGSKTITIFVLLPTEDGDEFDTLIINPANVLKHEQTVDGDDFHLVLKLNIPVSTLLDSRTGGDSKTIHFVLNARPDPQGAILGLLGQHLPESPKLDKMSRVAVSEETIQICGNVTTIISTPVSEREMRISQTRQMLSENIQEPLPQFEIGLSQPKKQNLKAFTASEPIVANIRAPRCSLDDQIIPSSVKTIPDSLPISIVPDSQKRDDSDWKLQSSFDYKCKIDESEISVGDDTMEDFGPNNTMNEETPAKEPGKGEKLLNVSNLASASSSKKSVKKMKNPLQFEKSEPAAAIILVGTDCHKPQKSTENNESIKIQNNFNKDKSSNTVHNNSNDSDMEVMKVVTADPDAIVEIENPLCDEVQEKVQKKEPVSTSAEQSPDLSQQLDQINQDISETIPSSPGDVYKTMLRGGLKNTCKEALSSNSSPTQKKFQTSYKRRLMDADENFLCTQNSQESPAASQAKKLPVFARKKAPTNQSSSFVISKNKSFQQGKRNKMADESIVPIPPQRKSILKKKFLTKTSEAATTPKLGEFDFDVTSPIKSDASWVKTEKKKKRTAGFKTKKQKLEEEKVAKKKIREERKRSQPKKKLTKKKLDKSDFSCSEDDYAVETPAKKQDIKIKSRSPSPINRSTRYSMRRGVQKVNYKEPGSDEEVKSISPSEFSTTTNSTVVKSSKRKATPPSSQECEETEFDPVAMMVDLERDISAAPSKKCDGERKVHVEEINVMSNANDISGSQNCQKSTGAEGIGCRPSGLSTVDEIARISANYDEKSLDEDSSSQSLVQKEITRIPSSDTVGIPLSFKTDVSSIATSLVSKDPSPIIKTNFFKLPNKEMKSIKLNLDPEVRQISPSISEENNPSTAGNIQIDATERKSREVLGEIFEDQILEKESRIITRSQKKYSRKPRTGKEKKTPAKPIYQSQSELNGRLDKLQESFDQINQSTVLEVEVSKSNNKMPVVKEDSSNKKEDKLWLDGSESGSSERESIKDVNSKVDKQISSVSAGNITDLSVQFTDMSNCMVTGADSSGMLMDIEEYHTPEPGAVRAEETLSVFSKILEESKLAGRRDSAPSTLVSTPTKLSHIREAEKANVSPFQQFLEKVGEVRSPIKRKVHPKKLDESRIQDSGFETLGQISSNWSSILSPTKEKLSKRPRLQSPVSETNLASSSSQSKHKEKVLSQSPGTKELEEHYKMLCRTPGRLSQASQQSRASSADAICEDFMLKSQDFKLPEFVLSPISKDMSHARPSTSATVDENNDMVDEKSQGSSFAIPTFMLDTESGMQLQMLRSTSKNLKENQRKKSRENVEMITKDVTIAAQKFFYSTQIKRNSGLLEIRKDINESICHMESNLELIKKKEEIALRNIAAAHKVQKDARIALENKMALLKQKLKPSEVEPDESLQEFKETLFKQLQTRQAKIDKDQIDKQRKQLLKQISLLMMSDLG